MCSYSAFSPYLAVHHSVTAHQKKSMLYVCNNGECGYQCLAEVDMAQHLKLEHRDHDNPVPLVCSATLVKKTSSGSGYVECSVLVKRTGMDTSHADFYTPVNSSNIRIIREFRHMSSIFATLYHFFIARKQLSN